MYIYIYIYMDGLDFVQNMVPFLYKKKDTIGFETIGSGRSDQILWSLFFAQKRDHRIWDGSGADPTPDPMVPCLRKNDWENRM